MEHLNGNNIVDLGAPKTIKAGRDFHALVRHLEPDGTLELSVRQTPQGAIGAPDRSQFVDAEELVEMMRPMVREEIRAALNGE